MNCEYQKVYGSFENLIFQDWIIISSLLFFVALFKGCGIWKNTYSANTRSNISSCIIQCVSCMSLAGQQHNFR